MGELVVGGAAHDVGVEQRDRRLVERAAKRARRQHVDVGEHRVGGAHPGRAGQLGCQRALGLVDVRDDHARAVGGEHPRERLAHVPGADDGDAAAGEVRGAEPVLGAGAHRGVHAEGGERAGIAEPAEVLGQADQVLGARGDQAHVGRARPDVLGRDVPAAERLDGVAEVQQHRAARLGRELGAGLHAHDALAAAQVDTGHGGLEGHPLGEAQGIGHGVAGMGVSGQPAAAERGAERGRVHRDDRVCAAARPTAHQQQFVVEA